jgi:hypothetical protein
MSKEKYTLTHIKYTSKMIKILDVAYSHLTFDTGDEMYVTDQGLAVQKHLIPENFWTDRGWFQAHSERQKGSSNVYKIRTKPIGDKSLNIALKWNRMGIDIPGVPPDETSPLENARFLSPFEEFQLLQELKESPAYVPGTFSLQVPLAIYLPHTKEDYTRLGRRHYLMSFIQKRHENDVRIDIERKYAVIYQWMEGIDIVEAYKQGLVERENIQELAERAAAEMRDTGFVVADHKAEHVIVKPIGPNVFRDINGNIAYGYVDYELLERTPEREKTVRQRRRHEYLTHMPKRFDKYAIAESSLSPTQIFDVPYLYNEIPSSKGRLWVVGNDPFLFDYFLPEKWRHAKRTRLSLHNNIFHKVSKDGINLVLKISKVGEKPDADPFSERERKIMEHGYNSPFEEVALALELNGKELPTIYPRAIYMTGSSTTIPEQDFDDSRYVSHADIVTPDKHEPVLKKNHDYTILWGYWNGSDEMLADYDGGYYTALNALNAYRQHLINKATYFEVMEKTRDKMVKLGVEDLNLRGTHILLALNNNHEIVTGKDRLPITRICNFELLKRIEPFRSRA